MKYEYIFYKTDESFDYGDFPGSAYVCFEPHGFEIDIDDDGIIDMSSLQGMGHFGTDIENKCTTLPALSSYIDKNLKDVSGEDEIELFQRVKELKEFQKLITKNLELSAQKSVH